MNRASQNNIEFGKFYASLSFCPVLLDSGPGVTRVITRPLTGRVEEESMDYWQGAAGDYCRQDWLSASGKRPC